MIRCGNEYTEALWVIRYSILLFTAFIWLPVMMFPVFSFFEWMKGKIKKRKTKTE